MAIRRQVVKKVQRHSLRYMHLSQDLKRPLKERVQRVVKTLPRTRGFLPQDFSSILERIPDNFIYTPVLHEDRVKGTDPATKGFSDISGSAKVVHGDMDNVGNQESGNECLGKRSIEGNVCKERLLNCTEGYLDLETSSREGVMREGLTSMEFDESGNGFHDDQQEGAMRESLSFTETNKNGNGFHDKQQVEVK